MKHRLLAPLACLATLAGCGGGDITDAATPTAADEGRARLLAASSTATPPSQVAATYAVDFVATAASGSWMNDAGDVVGRAYTDIGCGPFCLPPQQALVWRGGVRTLLPAPANATNADLYPRFINNAGLIAGVAGTPSYSTRAVAWVPAQAGYTAQDIGLLPGMVYAEVGGVDELGRVVGWSNVGGAIPTATAPFQWTQGGGLINLASDGYPNERPAAMSRGGHVVTWNFS